MSALLFLLCFTVNGVYGLNDQRSTPSGDPDLKKLEETVSTLQCKNQVQDKMPVECLTNIQSELMKTTGEVTVVSFPAVQPGDNFNPATLTSRVLQLEEMVSSLQTQAQTQEQKYAAVLSNVLSKLTETTKELSSLRNDNTFLKDKLASIESQMNINENASEASLDILKSSLNSLETNFTSLMSKISYKNADFNGSDLRSVLEEVMNLSTNVGLMKTDIQTGQIKVQTLSAKEHSLTSYLSDLQVKINMISDNLTNVRISSEANFKSLTKLSGTFCSRTESSAFKVIQETSNYNVSAGEIIIFSSLSYNSESSFNSNTGIFTAPINGTYMFWVDADVMNNSTGSVKIKTSKDRQFRHGVWQKPIIFTTTGFLEAGERVWFAASRTISFRKYSSYGGSLLHPYCYWSL